MRAGWAAPVALVALAAAGCGGPGAAPVTAGGPTIAAMAELGVLMRDDINPAFSRLTFLLVHGDGLETDPATLAGELQRNAASLRTGLARLRTLPSVPTQTDEGRAVFFTFAESIDRSTEELVRAVAGGQRKAAASQLARIADTCNQCHHFFRLKIEDAMVSHTAGFGDDADLALARNATLAPSTPPTPRSPR